MSPGVRGTGSPFQQERHPRRRATPDPVPDRPPGALVPIALSVVVNAVTLVGVVAFGWPPGNAYALFWIENVVIGLANIPRILTARGTEGAGRRTRGISSPAGLTAFFCFHYGIFCLVQGVFTAIIAVGAGFDPSFVFLGLPVVLIVVRYTVETATTWWGRRGLRWTMSPGRAMFSVYPRIVVLQVAVLAGFFLTIASIGTGGRLPEPLAPIVHRLPAELQQPGVLLVALLVVIKTVVDIVTTSRSVSVATRT